MQQMTISNAAETLRARVSVNAKEDQDGVSLKAPLVGHLTTGLGDCSNDVHYHMDRFYRADANRDSKLADKEFEKLVTEFDKNGDGQISQKQSFWNMHDGFSFKGLIDTLFRRQGEWDKMMKTLIDRIEQTNCA